MRRWCILLLIMVLSMVLMACGKTEEALPYTDSFDEGNNVEMRWAGIKTVIPSTWDLPVEVEDGIVSVYANMSSTKLFKIECSDKSLTLESEEILNGINDLLENYYVGEGYSEYNFLDSKFYNKNEHENIPTKQVLVLTNEARWSELDAEFTSYCIHLSERFYVWTIVKLSNEEYSSIKDLEKVVNAIEIDEAWTPTSGDISGEENALSSSGVSDINVR